MSSRAAPAPHRAGSLIGGTEYTVAALVQANHGIRPWLTILGRRSGKLMPEGALSSAEMGSIIVVILPPMRRCRRCHCATWRKRAGHRHRRGAARRAATSGDIFLAFSTAECRADAAIRPPCWSSAAS
jgi:D-aminopeptidase